MARLLGVLGLILSVVGVALTIYFGVRDPKVDATRPKESGTPRPKESETPRPSITALGGDPTRLRYPLPAAPLILATDGDRVMVVTSEFGVYELNNSCRCSIGGPVPTRPVYRQLATWDGYSAPSDMDVGSPVWVAALDSAYKVRSNRVPSRYGLGKSYLAGIVRRGGHVYFAYDNGIIERRSAGDMEVDATVATGYVLTDLSLAQGGLWGVGYEYRGNYRTGPSHVLRLSPRTLRVTRDIRLEARYVFEGSLSNHAFWATGERGTQTVIDRVELKTNEQKVVALPSSSFADVAANGAEVWVLLSSGDAIRLEEATGRPTRTIATTALGSDKVSTDLAVSVDALWVSSPIENFVMRFQL